MIISIIAAIIVYIFFKKALKYIMENDLEDGTNQWGEKDD